MTPDLPLVIEPATLEPLLADPDLLLVDLCQPQVWQQIHIPGAAHVHPGELVGGIPPAAGKLPSPAQLQSLFARIGYTADKHIVAYDDEGGGWAGRFLWTLAVIGHRHASYLNGGLHAWFREQHPVTAEVRNVIPTSVNLVLDTSVIAEMDTVLKALEDPGVTIWDARSPEEYAGLRSGSARAGHIPGAVNLDWLELMDRERNMRLLPEPALRQKLAHAGIAPGQTIITHCQSHHRSGLSWLVAKALGYKALGYHGSWGEWGNDPNVPIETMA